MDKWKNKLRDIANFILGIIFCTCVSVLAETCTTTINSSDVTYGENSTAQAEVTNLISTAGNMNLRLTELEDYDLDNRLSTLEGYFKNNPTSYFNQNDLRIGANDTSDHESYINFYSSNVNRGAIGISNSGDMQIVSKNASGVNGQGTLDIRGNPVQINGVNAYGFTSIQSDSVTMTGGLHQNYIVYPSSVIPSGMSIRYAFVQSTPNSAWVFAHLNYISNTIISIGAYNSYSGDVTGKFTVVIIYN